MADDRDPLDRMVGLAEQSAAADAQMAETLAAVMGSVQQATMGMDRYEYAFVADSLLNQYGADRWRVVRVPPLSQDCGSVFLMERLVLAGDGDLSALMGG